MNNPLAQSKATPSDTPVWPLTLLVPCTTLFRFTYPWRLLLTALHAWPGEPAEQGVLSESPTSCPQRERISSLEEACWVEFVSLLMTGSLMICVYS